MPSKRYVDPVKAGEYNARVVTNNQWTFIDAYIWRRWGRAGVWMIGGLALAALALIVIWAFTG